MSGRDLRVRTELAADPRSVREARRAVRDVLRAWGLEHLEPSAVLLTSELATNAVLHARSALAVEVERRDDSVRIAVTDASSVGPLVRNHGLQAGTGRGLGLVRTLSTSWGCDPAPAPYAKTVWFELPLDPALLPDPVEGALLV